MEGKDGTSSLPDTVRVEMLRPTSSPFPETPSKYAAGFVCLFLSSSDAGSRCPLIFSRKTRVRIVKSNTSPPRRGIICILFARSQFLPDRWYIQDMQEYECMLSFLEFVFRLLQLPLSTVTVMLQQRIVSLRRVACPSSTRAPPNEQRASDSPGRRGSKAAHLLSLGSSNKRRTAAGAVVRGTDVYPSDSRG